MITVPELAAEALGSFLAEHMNRRFGTTQPTLTELIPSVAGSPSNASATATRCTIMSSTRCW